MKKDIDFPQVRNVAVAIVRENDEKKWDGAIHGKKYIFVAGCVVRQNLTDIPLPGKNGVMIR